MLVPPPPLSYRPIDRFWRWRPLNRIRAGGGEIAGVRFTRAPSSAPSSDSPSVESSLSGSMSTSSSEVLSSLTSVKLKSSPV